MKYLIVNADDFGQSAGINQGIIESFEQGIVTSTSLMVRWPAAAAAAAYAKRHPELSLGLHLDLGEWRSVADDWEPIYQVIPTETEAAVREEVERQLDAFERLTGATPSHIDTHQHVHLRDPFRPVVCDVAESLNLPLRHVNAAVQYCGEFYGMAWNGEEAPEKISFAGLLRILSSLSAPITELACHPGRDHTLDTMYRSGRAAEILALTDPRLPEALESLSISLCSFLTLPETSKTAPK